MTAGLAKIFFDFKIISIIILRNGMITQGMLRFLVIALQKILSEIVLDFSAGVRASLT